jgi:uncharacterized protein YndB with AHSA1/START domain
MGFIKKVVVLGLVAGGGTFLYGRSLPREHTVRSTVTLVASSDTVFKVIRNIGTTNTWWSDMKSSRRLTSGRGETWEENMGPAGVITVTISRVVPGKSMVHTIVDDGTQGWGGTWTYQVASTGAGTEVTITEDGYVDSPFFRVLMKLRGKYRTIDSYLSSLGAHFGEPVTPRHG